jgi:hypothetical protein
MRQPARKHGAAGSWFSFDAKAFVADAKRRGGNAEAVSVGPRDHGESILQAAPLIRPWFDTLSAARRN